MAPFRQEQLARDFFAAMGPKLEDFKENFRQRPDENVKWESVGLPAHHSRPGSIDYLDTLNTTTGMHYCTIEILHAATASDLVLSERIDTMRDINGAETRAFRIMVAIEVCDGRTVRYTDYFDTASL